MKLLKCFNSECLIWLLAVMCFSCQPKFISGSKSVDKNELSVISLAQPEIQFAENEALINESSIDITFSTTTDKADSIKEINCSLSDSLTKNCLNKNVRFENLSDGDYTMTASLITASGLTTQSRRIFRKDSQAPTISVSQTPPISGPAAASIFVFTAQDNLSGVQSIQCSVNNSNFANCISPLNYTSMALGSHNLRIRAQDRAKNFSSIYSYTWTITSAAVAAPALVLVSTPQPYSSLTTGNFSFNATNSVRFECRLDSATYSTCLSPHVTQNLINGAHQFRVRAVGADGNYSSEALYSWVVDNLAPTTPTITSDIATASTTALKNINFSFVSTDTLSPITSYQCALNSTSFSACSSPLNYSNLADGNHQFRARAIDAAGNTSSIANFNWTITTPTAPPPPPPSAGNTLQIDLSYVDKNSTQYSRFRTMVDAALAGSPDYGFEPQHAAMMFKLTGETRYCDYAITFTENCANSRYAGANCGVQGAESVIAAGGRAPVSGDSYLEVGPIIGSLALTYAWCGQRMTSAQKLRWENYANQAVYNVWNPNLATWGGRLYTWTGWSIDNPGNNYYYSFVEATMYWALASGNSSLLTLTQQKLQALVNYYTLIPGGGSLEGTGYGAAHMRLFQIYQVWKDSTGVDLANMNSHLTDSIRFWVHATTPNRTFYAPVGDLARSSFPDLFDYHRRLILQARRLTNNVGTQDLASWWLNHISVNQMSRRIDGQWDLLPAGTNTNAAPSEPLVYHAAGVGRIFSRTSWDTNALWLSFNSGAYVESHAHQDQGSFTLANNNFLAVTNNIFSASGINQTSNYHNILRFQQGTTVIPQRSETRSTLVLNQFSDNGSVDATADLTPAYGGNSAIQSWRRNIRFANRTLTVSDSYNVSSGTQAIFQIQAPVQPVVSGNTITAGSLRIRVISPATATINVVSAERFRIEVSGGNGSYVVELTDQ